jgi:hypothetical protein
MYAYVRVELFSTSHAYTKGMGLRQNIIYVYCYQHV